MAVRRRLIRAGALALTAAMLLTACSDDSGRRRDRRDRDDDEEETRAEETIAETSEETAATEATLPAPSAEEVNEAYLEVLSQYESEIRQFENEFNLYSGITPSINYMDINGDGINELIFKYISDDQFPDVDFSYLDGPAFANVAIYMYNRETGEADCLLDENVESHVGSWDATCDVVMLDNGNFFIPNYNGRMGYYTQSMSEYQYDGTAFVLVNSWMVNEELPMEVQYDEATPDDIISSDAMLNDQEITPEEFYSAQQDYLSRLAVPLMPTSSRFFEDGYNMTDLFGRDWCGIPGSLFAAGNYMTYDAFVASADPDYAAALATEEGMRAAYLEILLQYETYIRQVENAPYNRYTTCAYGDMTGDGHPEMMFTYVSDEERGYGGNSEYYMMADICIYTYDFAAGQAVELHHIDGAIANAAAGSDTNVVLLNDGRIIVTTSWGDEDGEHWTDVYEVSGNTLVQTDTLYEYYYLDDSGDDYQYVYEYTFNDGTINEEQYDAYRFGYGDVIDHTFFIDPYYADDWYTDDQWAQDVLNAPTYAMDCDALIAILSN